ncbi:hypothetical protein GPECTOR_193g316 [Gonium pectorale]|uniref:F-box domain-containing protein n=1 Tax=Gonium pectorale TaxID=33097 RepID=A0A150FX31_GONPE|nr:hypothetical protein GPECTOR_193g316 [Gonium pectorale]|eukprot:KXZ42159.1 hypothetical protein GPECTOR_193g316 [Gonium pectorale]
MSAASAQQQPQQQSACTSRVWPQLLPELAEKIVSCLDPNEVPSFRLVNKASASQFRAPHHTTIHLSQPVPPHAFAAHWFAPGAVRGLTLARRRQLLSLTAASGVVANLEMAERAAGCLATTERLWRGAGEVDSWSKHWSVAAAVGSPTPDWAAKVQWLEAQGCPRNMPMTEAQRPDAVARLVWLRARSFPPQPVELQQAAAAGNVAAVQYLLGQLGVLPVDAIDCARQAARNGHLHVLIWLVGTFGAGAVRMGPDLLVAAAESGSVQLMAWLRERGCGWDASAITKAADSGCEEAVEWLVAQGCPVQGNGEPYFGACRNGDLAMAVALRRLGVPWGPPGAVFVRAARQAPPPMLRWLVEEDCPVERFTHVLAAIHRRDCGRDEALRLLREATQQRRERAQAAARAEELAAV